MQSNPPKVLVAYASKHGSTKEMAEFIGNAIRVKSFLTDVFRVNEVQDVSAYDVLVIGSAVYAGDWLESARSFVVSNKEILRHKKVWFFTTGPVGQPLVPAYDNAVIIDDLVNLIDAKEHKIFAGKIDKEKLSFPERAIVFALRAPDGDFRNWEEIALWVDQIVTQI